MRAAAVSTCSGYPGAVRRAGRRRRRFRAGRRPPVRRRAHHPVRHLYGAESRTLKRLPPYVSATGPGSGAYWTPRQSLARHPLRRAASAAEQDPASNPTPLRLHAARLAYPAAHRRHRRLHHRADRSQRTARARTSATTRCCNYASSIGSAPSIRSCRRHLSANCYPVR